MELNFFHVLPQGGHTRYSPELSVGMELWSLSWTDGPEGLF